jgi:predicted metalloprotease
VFVDIANFDVLENPVYIDKFFYQQMDRRFENKSSDFVAKTLFLGDMMDNNN